ncbi:MAG: GNAT family N-acetyltransferase [Rhizobiaceae bacterium]|nr:GNAT family N-acetyltransferase [Rhizobiaceae bacterium]
MAGSLTVSIHDRMEPLEAAWRALEAHDFNSLHHGYDWCLAWIRQYRRRLMIVEGRMDGELAFILPLEVVRGRMFTSAQFVGAEHSNLNTGLMSEAFLAAATPETMAFIGMRIRAAAAGVDFVLLTNIPQVWRGRRMPFAMLPFVENQNRAFALTMQPGFVATLAQLSAKRRRKKFSASHRRLEALGGYEHVVAATPAEKNRFLDLFFEQKGQRLVELDLPNVFACPKTREFLHSLAQLPQDGNRFALRLHALRMTGGEHAGEVPAIAGLSRKGDHVIVQFCTIGSGPLTHAAPGELLFHLMVESYNGQDVGLFDFGIGDMPFKRAWTNVETVQVNVTLPITQLGRLAALKEETATRLKSMIKQNPAVYSFLQRIRAKVHNAPQGKTGEPDRDED